MADVEPPPARHRAWRAPWLVPVADANRMTGNRPPAGKTPPNDPDELSPQPDPQESRASDDDLERYCLGNIVHESALGPFEEHLDESSRPSFNALQNFGQDTVVTQREWVEADEGKSAD